MTRFLRIGNDLINVDQIRLDRGGRRGQRGGLHDHAPRRQNPRVPRRHRPTPPRSWRGGPATPGYTILDYYGDAEAGHEVIRLPVVAWRVSENIAIPIAPNDEAAAHCGIYPTILMPDGRVIQQYGATWANETAWRAEKAEEARRKRTGADAEEPATDRMSVMFDKLMGKGRAS